MNVISASTINLKSPYKVVQVDELSVRFKTTAGVRYIVGFTPDVFIYDEGGYEFYIIPESETAPQDPLVFHTIMAVIEDLFTNASESVMIYICAPDDDRQAVRARLFEMWFHKAKAESSYSLHTYNSQEEDGTQYFYGLLLRKDNPSHDALVSAFMNFIVDY